MAISRRKIYTNERKVLKLFREFNGSPSGKGLAEAIFDFNGKQIQISKVQGELEVHTDFPGMTTLIVCKTTDQYFMEYDKEDKLMCKGDVLNFNLDKPHGISSESNKLFLAIGTDSLDKKGNMQSRLETLYNFIAKYNLNK